VPQKPEKVLRMPVPTPVLKSSWETEEAEVKGKIPSLHCRTGINPSRVDHSACLCLTVTESVSSFNKTVSSPAEIVFIKQLLL